MNSLLKTLILQRPSRPESCRHGRRVRLYAHGHALQHDGDPIRRTAHGQVSTPKSSLEEDLGVEGVECLKGVECL